jgi:hypothetical protein
MSRKISLPQSTHHLAVYNEDWEYISSRFGIGGIKPVGVSNVIRALIHKAVLEWREAENVAATAARRNNGHANTTNIDSTQGSSSGEYI